MKKNKILLLTFLVLFLNLSLYSSFEDVEIGAKATSLSGAYVAYVDDVSGILYNPAGLLNIRRPEIFLSYGKPFYGIEDLSSNVVILGMPIKKEFNIKFLKIKNKEIYFGNFAFGYFSPIEHPMYKENKIIMSYSYPLMGKLRNLMLGINLCYLSVSYGKEEGYSELNTIFEKGSSKSNIGLDFGAIYKCNKDIDLGFSIKNLNEPDLGIKYENKVESVYNLGILIKNNVAKVDNLNLGLCFAGADRRIKFGFETFILKSQKIALRSGMNIGSREFRNVSLGLGYKDKFYQIDYSFYYPLSGISSSYGSHQVSIVLRWGKQILFPEEEKEIKEKERKEAMVSELAKFAGELLPPPTIQIEITPEDREKAVSLLKEAKGDIAKGYYELSVEKVRKADELLKHTDSEVKEILTKIEIISGMYPTVTGKDKKSELLRRAIDRFIENDAETAVSGIIYLTQLYPDDTKLKQLYEIITKRFPAVAAEQKIYIVPGLTIVQQLLQEALELIRSGKYTQAIVVCDKVLKIEPDNTLALTRKGSAYWLIGDKQTARKLWMRVLELEPDNETVKKFLHQK